MGALQCFLTAIALFSIKSANKLANRLLGIFLIVIALFITDLVIIDSGYYQTFPYFYGFSSPIDFLIPIPLFFYIKALTIPNFRLKWGDIKHLIPFFIILLLELPSIFLGFEEKKIEFYNDINALPNLFDYYIAIGITHIYILAYFVMSFRLITIASKSDLNEKTSSKILWIKRLLIILLIIAIISTILDFIPSFIFLDDFLTPFFLTIFIYGMGFMGIRQSDLFTMEKLLEKKDKYKKSTLSDDMVEKILRKLTILMEDEKIYRDGNINLPTLSKKLAISTHQLSQILNERLDKNFFNYISEYRIREAKELLLDNNMQNITMLELSLNVGFNSLSAFNTAFKKHTGMSPTEFKKNSNSLD